MGAVGVGTGSGGVDEGNPRGRPRLVGRNRACRRGRLKTATYALQIREVNDVPSGKDATGRNRRRIYVFHHMIWATDKNGGGGTNTPWPVHEVGRGADFFPPEAARLLKANESIVSNSIHLHSNGRDTRAHLEIGFKFQPVGYQPTLKASQSRGLGNGLDISIHPNEANQQLHAYTVLQENTKVTSFEPHLHAPGCNVSRRQGLNIQTLSCAGYDQPRGLRLRPGAAAPWHDPPHHRAWTTRRPTRTFRIQLAGFGQSVGGQRSSTSARAWAQRRQFKQEMIGVVSPRKTTSSSAVRSVTPCRRRTPTISRYAMKWLPVSRALEGPSR